jgi:hypothetical protein
MAMQITSAIAVSFDYAGESLAFDLSGGSYTATVPAVTNARVLLAPSASELAAVLVAALSTASGATFSASMGTDGRWTIAVAGDTWKCNAIHTSTVGAILGWTASASTLAANHTAERQPKYLMLFAARSSSGWTQRTPISAAETIGGVSYGVTSGIVRWEDAVTFDFIPSDPTQVSTRGEITTPWEPDAASLSTLGAHATPWSVSDCLAVALGRTCALTKSFATIIASTSERYDLCAIAGTDLGAPRAAYQFPVWPVYRRWQVSLVRQSTPTGTRA